jgi:ABC-type bacteriocin/lantibiotic exporter with double-glycine peptidase domain
MELLPVRSFQETLYAGMCGPASLKMVLVYYGVDMAEKDLAKLCGTDPELGTSDKDIKNVAEGLGFIVEIHNNSLFEDIQSWHGTYMFLLLRVDLAKPSKSV